MRDLPNVYAGGLDRASHRRKDAAWLAAQLKHASTRFVPVWQARNLVRGADGLAPRAVLLERADYAPDGQVVLLGVGGEHAYFAVDLSHLDEPLARLPASAGSEFVDLRRVGPLLPRDESALLAYARGILYWHQRHRHCAVCGAPSLMADAGHMRRCTDAACNATHFPRTDPAVIMLVTDGSRCLLGRQPTWPPGMHSTLAGFVEPGESLEEAVAREVREETGIAVTDIVYHSSQPWPFPSSLMLGFSARAVTRALAMAGSELEHAAWYERDWIRAHTDDDDFRLPRKDSVARRLIEDWLNRSASAAPP
ncbi:MAG: NAD(+) diphosphatase [Alphaproteobacteria bacterium]|nr:NAD(+) diphosphatase [Alphaproteobacteria bacterium]